MPKSSKRKKKKHSSFVKTERDDPNKIAAMVCSQKQSGTAPRHLSSDTTPDEVKQSSKRRKFTRKNSVLDTPLKKQVRNFILEYKLSDYIIPYLDVSDIIVKIETLGKCIYLSGLRELFTFKIYILNQLTLPSNLTNFIF